MSRLEWHTSEVTARQFWETKKIVSQFVELESQRQHRVWFGRVPSHSNLADGPSRLCFEAVQKLGAVRTSVDWEGTAEHLGI